MKSIDRIVRKVDLPIKWIIFVMTAVLNLLPFVWGFITSFKSTPDINAYPPTFMDFLILWYITEQYWAAIFPQP